MRETRISELAEQYARHQATRWRLYGNSDPEPADLAHQLRLAYLRGGLAAATAQRGKWRSAIQCSRRIQRDSIRLEKELASAFLSGQIQVYEDEIGYLKSVEVKVVPEAQLPG